MKFMQEFFNDIGQFLKKKLINTWTFVQEFFRNASQSLPKKLKDSSAFVYANRISLIVLLSVTYGVYWVMLIAKNTFSKGMDFFQSTDISNSEFFAMFAVLGLVIGLILYFWSGTTPDAQCSPETTTDDPPKKTAEKDNKKGKEEESTLVWFWEKVKPVLVWTLKIVAVVVIGYLIFVVITEKLPAIGKSVKEFTDPKNYPTRQNSSSNNDRDKGLGIYAPVDPEDLEKIPRSTSTALPKPGEIWILSWDRCDTQYQGRIDPNLKRQSKPYKIIVWSKDYIKMETEYFDYNDKQKAVMEWDKKRNSEYGSWDQTRPKSDGKFRLNREPDGTFTGWTGDTENSIRLPLFLRRQ